MQMVSAGLFSRSPREKLTELLGSLLLSAAVAMAMSVVLSLILTGKVQVGEVFWLGTMGTFGPLGRARAREVLGRNDGRADPAALRCCASGWRWASWRSAWTMR